MLNVDASFEYIVDSCFKATVNYLKMDWESEPLLDMTSFVTTDWETLNITFNDSNKAVEGILASSWFSNSWHSNTDGDWIFLVDEILVTVDNQSWMDSALSFHKLTSNPATTDIFGNGDSFTAGVMEMRSLSPATMQLDMGMNFTFFEDDEFFQIRMDHCRMKYDETVYLNTGVVVPAIPDTQSPTAVPTSSPVASPPMQTFIFTDISMFIVGAPDLTEENEQVVEDALVEFYNIVYSNTSSRRKLRVTGITDFETFVEIIGDSPTSDGNTITYYQTVTFATSTGDAWSEKEAQAVLTSPFEDEGNHEIFVNILKENPTFANVTTVDRPDVGSAEDDDDNAISVILLVFLCIGWCIVLVGAGTFFYNRNCYEKPDQGQKDMGRNDPWLNDDDNANAREELFVDEENEVENILERDAVRADDVGSQDSESDQSEEGES